MAILMDMNKTSTEYLTGHRLVADIAASLRDVGLRANPETVAAAIEIVTAYEVDLADYLAAGGDLVMLTADVRYEMRTAQTVGH